MDGADENREKKVHIPDDAMFERHPLAYRLQHIGLMCTVFVLLLTGLPLLFPESRFIQALFVVPELFDLRGKIHRIAALVLVAFVVIHLLYLIFSSKARKDLKGMLPRKDDLPLTLNTLRYNLGLNRERPKAGRFTPAQKAHYWILCIGVLIMIVTGLILWKQEISMMWLPKWAIDLATLVHGDEALLVFIVLLIWHIYAVHLNPDNFPMSPVWLTGKISARKMKKLHPLEFEEMEQRREKDQAEKERHATENLD